MCWGRKRKTKVLLITTWLSHRPFTWWLRFGLPYGKGLVNYNLAVTPALYLAVLPVTLYTTNSDAGLRSELQVWFCTTNYMGTLGTAFLLKERASMSLLCPWSIFFPSDPTKYSCFKAIWMCFWVKADVWYKDANSRVCIVWLKPNHLPGPVGPQTNFAILWNNLCNPD